MLLLIVFGFVAGAATAVSPCVLPVLPVALSAGATGGRRRPLGVVTGLVLSFTFATIALVYVISALGLPDDLLRNLAIVVLVGFGLALIVPRLAAWVEVAVSTGAGIAADERERVFEPFVRGEASRSRGGAGLGMAISRAIVEGHGGRIWLADSDAGTRVRFVIPT